MAKKKQIQEPEFATDQADKVLSKAEQYVENNLNTVGIVLGSIIVVILAFWGYNKYITQPREAEAQEMIYPAQRNFERDSLRLALYGNGQDLGFIDVADEYSGTKTGNLARYYAGICHLNLGEYSQAIESLDDFSSDDGTFNVIAKGAIGDAFHELNQPEEALEYYRKAVGMDGNDFVTPIYLKKGAQTAEMLEEWSTALKMYNRLRNEFPDASQSQEVEKFIAYCEAKAGKA